MTDAFDISLLLGNRIARSQAVTSPSPDAEDDFHVPPPPPVEGSIVWNEEQKSAIQQISAWRRDPHAPRFLSLTGAAGSGKTSVLSALREHLGRNVAWAAMTGKAASRMREAAGVRAKILHSVLYHPPREIDNRSEQKIDLAFEDVKAVQSSLLVLDESSMVSPRIFSDIERSAYKKVILVGDPFQLPPVLSRQEESVQGEDYSVFREVKGPFLGKVMRASGAVLNAATCVREKQEIPESTSESGGSTYEYVNAYDPDSALRFALERYFSDPVGHVICTWKNDNRMTANRIIRNKLGYTDSLPQPGEVVVVRKNVHHAGIMNGDDVVVEEWLDVGPTLAGVETRKLSVRVETDTGHSSRLLLVPTKSFDGTMPYVGLSEMKRVIEMAGCDDPVPITYGYCKTGHMMQGSEARRVTTFLPGDLRSSHFSKMTRLPDGTYMPFSMRFLYVAISRAREYASLIISR